MPRLNYDPRDVQPDPPRSETRAEREARGTRDIEASGPVATGRIKRLHDKGFGFIQDDQGAEYFFHRSETGGMFDVLAVGDRVQFQPMRSSKGPRAHQVVRLAKVSVTNG